MPSCNLIIRFDQAATVCSFIQSRGRARMQNSDYVLLIRRHVFQFCRFCFLSKFFPLSFKFFFFFFWVESRLCGIALLVAHPGHLVIFVVCLSWSSF